MRSKLFLLLALFGAFSTASYAQTATATHNVTSDLTEVREITLGGVVPNIAIKRSILGNTLYLSNTATMVIEHDLAFNQKIVVSTVLGAGTWTDRGLVVGGVAPVGDATWLASTIATTSLITAGVADPAADFAINIPASLGAPTAAMPLNYSGSAGLTAVAGPAVAVVTYNLTDG